MIRLIAFGARFLLTVICETIRLKEKGFDLVSERFAQPHQSVIFAFWHNRIFYLTYYLARRFVRPGHKLVVLSSLSWDGEIMACLESKLGATVVRGSTSRRAKRGILELCRMARPNKKGQSAGYSPVLTVDGPRGPKYQIQPGIIFVAQKTGLPIVPISYQPSRCYIFNSWDNFILPLPFSRIKVCYGKPLLAKKDMTQEEITRLRHELKEELLRISGEIPNDVTLPT